MSRYYKTAVLLMPKVKVKQQSKIAKLHSSGTNIDSPRVGPFFQLKDSSILITVYAKPGAKETSITGVCDDCVSISIAAAPQEGAANVELCKFLAKVVNCPKRYISLEKGFKSRNKVIKVSPDINLSLDEISLKLSSS